MTRPHPVRRSLKGAAAEEGDPMERVPRLQCPLQGPTDEPGDRGKMGGKGFANTRGEISESMLGFNRFKKKQKNKQKK